MKKARTPLREQRIHATESVQIIKVEPDCEIVDQKSTRLPMVTQSNSVLLKVEPTEFVAKPAQSLSPPQIKIPDILTQACHSIGMDSKGQFYRRSEAQKKAEERKIKNRHSASVSRERKKRHLEETETRNKILIKENEQLKKINKELMEKIRLLQAQIGTTNNSPPKRKRIMASTACLSIVFGLVFMTMPYAPESSGNISPVGGMENVHRGRRLFETNEVANESQFWLDDLVSDLRENHAFNELMYRAHFGSADVKKLVQRKLYEEFKISISPRRMSPSRFRGKLAIDSRTALKKSSKSSSQMCPNAASAQNLNEIHKSFKLWRTESEDINNIGEYNSTETGLVRIAPSKFWTHAELMESLSQIAFRNDTYYVLSNSPLPILAPVQMDNKLSPRMTFVIPAENTTLVDDHIEMHEIVCNVVETKNLVLYRGAVVSVEQEDDDTRIEIEV